ncbi:molybdopterin synthase sulfur carrier subunit [Caulobacter sp. CCUG 60055]|uniref:MoaD/ThiS family protein n=1 Tax=Caulobacter sp. CCUG 60055 TaxID=2100090 RepID=UPI001FA8150E|nr:MoaD/ThiS family protein [Caulobacter sp. CCUG 60055]MBQ1543529.1 MoaD/ThiS family protein [Caulobacteraceae bacterium]MCI3181436.1 molybdopterin synthase sulfur carrier subunit [Caulobacter sp. CCUG 60055]
MARVLLFGPLRDLAGWREREIAPQPASLFGLKAALSALDPELGEAIAAPGVQVAVDKALVRGDVALAATSEIAFLPPMSGG